MTHYYSRVTSDTVTTATTDKFYQRPQWATALRLDSVEDFEWRFASVLKDAVHYDASGATDALKWLRAEQSNLTDRDTATVFTLDDFAVADYLYLGASNKFESARVEMATATNDTASIMTVEYWNSSAWADITVTDGTDAAGDTLKQDGTLSWTVPAAWEAVDQNVDGLVNGLFYVRISVSVVLDASVEVESITLGSPATEYVDENETGVEGLDTGIIPIDTSKVGGVILKAAAGTPVVIAKWYGTL